MATRVCDACKKRKRLTKAFFEKHSKNAFRKTCRRCRLDRDKARYEKLRTDSKYRSKKAAKSNEWYWANRDRALESALEYHARPKVKARAAKRLAWRRANDPALVERERKWSRERKRQQLADPAEYEKHLARGRAWMAANSDRVAQYESRQPAAKAARAKRRYEKMKSTATGRALLKAAQARYRAVALANRRARKLKAEGRFSRADVQGVLRKQGDLCFWCAIDISGGRHTADHYIPLSKGGTNWPDNIVASCRSCNCRKWALHPDEFRRRLALSGGIAPLVH